MTKYSYNKPFYSLAFVFIFFISCNGQVKTNSLTDSLGKLITIANGQAKLLKTQRSNEYQNISCGLQDKAGNLWFGTSAEGVYRYDGKLFTQFTMADGLKCNSVSSILEDKTGNIWFGTRDGLCRYDGKKIISFPIIKSYMNVPYSSNDYYTENSTRETVWSIYQDKSGLIWFGTGDGVYCYDGKNFSRFLDNFYIINKGDLKLKMVCSILEDKKGNIWFASGMPPGEEGICRYDGTTLVSFKPKNEGWFREIIEDKNGNLIFATRIHGVLSCDLSVSNFSELSFSNFPQPKELLNNSLTTILNDRSGNIWMACDYGKTVGDTLGGVWCYMPSAITGGSAFTKITAKEVFFMLQDKDNNLWLGTRGTGLYRYDGKTLTNYTE